MSRFFPSIFLMAVPVAGMLALPSCSHNHAGEGHDHAAEVAENEAEHHEHGENEILMSPEDAARFGVSVQAVGRAPFAEVVKVIGEVMPASTDRVVVSAPTAGIVRLGSGIETGKNVKAGELIALVSAKGISGGDTNQSAKATLDAAKRELDRVTPLLKDGLVTKKDYNDALRAYEEAKSAYSPRAASGSASSSIAGVISELLVSDGSYVDAGQAIATVARSQRLTLRALLPWCEADFLPHIVSANIGGQASGRTVRLSERGGKLLSSTSSAGTATPGYIPVYFTFEDRGDIVPGTPAEVYLIGGNTSNILSVPLSAISEQQGENFVYVKTEDHAYEKRPVKIGRNDGERIAIVEGISEGDSVVSQGMTFVRLAETSTVVPEGHSHSH